MIRCGGEFIEETEEMMKKYFKLNKWINEILDIITNSQRKT
jgi:UTP:GlnB (protein PII) uridylyltransferase